MMEKKKCWVRWSTPESRAAGQISVLAIVETIVAVALYWWIAFYLDTHLHLVTSLLVAPLLLLRSERSIEAGVDWFLRGSFDAEDYKEWSRPRKNIWLVVIAVLGFAASWWFSSYLAHSWFEGQTGPLLFAASASIGLIGAIVGFMVAIHCFNNFSARSAS